MAGKITPLLDPARIALHLQSTKRTAALNEIARLLDGHPSVTNFAGFYEELLARDRLDTTCLGNGVALPHARTEHVKEIVLAVGRSDAGIIVDEKSEPVRLFFMLGTPKSKPGDYLAIVSSLCKLLRENATRAALLAATTPEEFITVLRTAEEKLTTAAPVAPTALSPSNVPAMSPPAMSASNPSNGPAVSPSNGVRP